jgi:lactoylglutathione lyase
MRLSHAMTFVSDMKRSVAFYRDVLGLPLRFESPEWTEFAAGGATFALHATADGPAPGGIHRAWGTARPGFHVDDLAAFHVRMLQHGVKCAQPPTDLHGAQLAQYIDPDGLTFSVSEERRKS